MRCLAAGDISRLATMDGDTIDDDHARACLACRRRITDERAFRVSLRALPAPRFAPDRMRELEAEIVAIVQRRAPGRASARPQRRWIAAVGAIALAAAATVSLVIVRDRHGDDETRAIAIGLPVDREAIAVADRATTAEDPAPMAAPSPALEIVRLIDGTLELDTRGSHPVEVHVGRDIVRVAQAKVTIRAHARAIVDVHVVIGAAHVTAGDRTFALERDTLWSPPAVEPIESGAPSVAPTRSVAPKPPAASPSLIAFADGWLALREGRHRDAIAEFDRVDDPVAIEEAMYWAAVAARRAGDTADADARVATFVARFPSSIYVARLHAH